MGRQLALSEALLACLSETRRPALRWYLASQPALVVGNSQKPGIADLAVCRERGVAVLRRTSGGAAVLVDATAINMEVALPAGHPLATSDVVRAYEWIGKLWAEALRSLGVAKARAIPVEEVRAIPPLAADDPLRLACFGTLSPWEVVVGKRKLVGLCQVRRRPGTLYQAGVYLQLDPKALGELLDLNNNRRKTLGTRLHNAALGLDQATQAADHALTADAVIAAVEQTLTTRLGVRLDPSDWTPHEREEAQRIERERFLPFN
ncbi:MAG TPA: hypothetical protein VLJ14_04525 [Ktedonobacterales bacterium]|nr:hypothetical protein [Ktedonobacterales bacterium]